jgi:hypothetical protein
LACAIALSLGLISILMPARMLAAELHSMAMATSHAMDHPCQQPCGGCDHGDRNTSCGAEGLCIASCNPIVMRSPQEYLRKPQIVASILLPTDESDAASLFPNPPKRPPRTA